MAAGRLPGVITRPGVRRAVVVVMILVARVVSPVYLPKGNQGSGKETNRVELSPNGKAGGVEGGGREGRGGAGAGKGDGGVFKNDSDVTWYLKVFDRKLMIWRCRNAIQRTLNHGETLPYLDLSCNVIGKFSSVTWYHGTEEIATKTDKLGDVEQRGRYSLSTASHVDSRGHSFANWIDIRLRIQNATTHDSGVYQFVVTPWDGPADRQRIYVDIVERRSKRYHHLHQPRHPKGSKNAVNKNSS